MFPTRNNYRTEHDLAQISLTLQIICIFNQSTPLQFYYHDMFRSLFDHLQVKILCLNHHRMPTYKIFLTLHATVVGVWNVKHVAYRL
jgi:hypothetical protein